ncbi:MAG: hypothetical protein H7Z20_11015, partial [Bdellovibrio sp.]|nr:hypothetical protein [Methylotenera sp.]
MANVDTVYELYETGYFAEARLEALNWLKTAPNDALAHCYVASCSYVLFKARDDDEITEDETVISAFAQAMMTHSQLASQLNSTETKLYEFRLYLAERETDYKAWLETDELITIAELQFLKGKFTTLTPKSRNISRCDIEIGLRKRDLDLVCKKLQLQLDDSLASNLPRQQNDVILADLYCKLGYYTAQNLVFAAAFTHYQQAVTLCTRDHEAIGRAGLLA